MDSWATAEEVLARPNTTGLSTENAAMVAEVASGILFDLSGNRYGTTTRTVRPEGCGHRSDGWDAREIVGWGLPIPYAAILGPWPLPGPAGGMLAPCGGCRRWSTNGITLSSPVVWDGDHPIDVVVDGVALDAANWSLVGGRLLVRTDGGIFPQCQDLSKPASAVGTCSVGYSYGVPPPRGGVEAAITLAVEFAKLWELIQGDGECRLPQRLQTIQRQGVTATVADSLSLIQKGGTGLTDVDLWVVSVNPKARRGGASIITPGFEYDDVDVIAGTAGGFG